MSPSNHVYAGFGGQFEVYPKKIAGLGILWFMFENFFKPKPQKVDYFLCSTFNCVTTSVATEDSSRTWSEVAKQSSSTLHG
jgi:hypothetical protein